MKKLCFSFAVLLLIIIWLANTGNLPAWMVALKAFPGGDKVGHFMLMGCMALLLNISLRQRRMTLAGRSLLLGSILMALLVTLEEFSQIWLPLRSFDWGDLLADYLGIAVLGGLLAGKTVTPPPLFAKPPAALNIAARSEPSAKYQLCAKASPTVAASRPDKPVSRHNPRLE